MTDIRSGQLVGRRAKRVRCTISGDKSGQNASNAGDVRRGWSDEEKECYGDI